MFPAMAYSDPLEIEFNLSTNREQYLEGQGDSLFELIGMLESELDVAKERIILLEIENKGTLEKNKALEEKKMALENEKSMFLRQNFELEIENEVANVTITPLEEQLTSLRMKLLKEVEEVDEEEEKRIQELKAIMDKKYLWFLNTATLEQLQCSVGMKEMRAASIHRLRERLPPFTFRDIKTHMDKVYLDMLHEGYLKTAHV